MTDIRALCKELLQGLDENRHPEVRYPGHLRLVMDRARAALAEPEPPADVEVAGLVAELRETAAKLDDDWYHASARIMRSAADLLDRLAPQPEPKRPSDEELTLAYAYAVAAAVDNKRGPFKNEDAKAAQLAGLRAVLAHWGNP